MGNFAANVIWLLHMLFIVWFIVTPFTTNPNMLTLHLFTGPFLWLHWIVNNDACSLTLLEMKLRGTTDCSESFFHQLVSPIYKIRDEEIKPYVWMATIILWLVTLSKVIKNPGMVTKMFRDAFRPFTGSGTSFKEQKISDPIPV